MHTCIHKLHNICTDLKGLSAREDYLLPISLYQFSKAQLMRGNFNHLQTHSIVLCRFAVFQKKIIAHFYSSLDIDNTAVHCSITVVCIFHCGTFLFLTRFPHCIIPTAWSCWLSCGVLVYYEILLPVYCTMKLSKPPSVQQHFCFKAFKISLD